MTTNRPPTRNLLTTAEIARITGLSVTTIRKSIRSGDIPSTKLLGRRYVPRAALNRMLDGLPFGGLSQEPRSRAREEVPMGE